MTACEVRFVDVELHEHPPARFERAEQQRLQLLHRLALVGVGVRERVRDQLGVRDEDRVEHLQARGAQRAAGLGDLDDRVGDLGDLRLGRAVRQRDPRVDAVLLEEAARSARDTRCARARPAADRSTDFHVESPATASTMRIGRAVAFE